MNKTHIILLKDNSFVLVSEDEANILFNKWANSESFVFEKDNQKIRVDNIKKISDVKSWLRSEKIRLSESGKKRCKHCFKVSFNSVSCDCRKFESKNKYEKDLYGSGSALFGGLEKNTRGKGEPPKELLKMIIVGMIKKHSWAKEYYIKDKIKGTATIALYAKIVWRAKSYKHYIDKVDNRI